MTRHGLALVACVAAGVAACGDEGECVEDIRAQVLAEVVEVTVGDAVVVAEVADSDVERARGWRHRRCGRDAIVLVGDGQPLPVWMCEVPDPLDLVFVQGGRVVDVVEAAPPCGPPCDACPRYGEGLPVDGVVEWPAGRYAAEIGDPVGGIPGT